MLSPTPTSSPSLETGSESRSSRPRSLPFLAVMLGAALFLAVLWPRLGVGLLWHHDETLTAERAREMIISGDPWAVRLNGKPNFHKPPIQYWLTVGLMRWFPDQPERAVRLPSALAAALCLLGTAALGRVAWPDDPVAGPAAALALAGCGFWVHFARMGMLDTGAALSVVGTLLGAEIVRRRGDARGWWLAAVAATFGAWQKAPYALGSWVVALLGRLAKGEPTPREVGRWPRTLWVAFTVSVAMVLVWPTVQVSRFGWESVLQGQSVSTGNLFTLNKSSGFQPWLYQWWLVRDWGAFGVLVPVAVGAAFWPGVSRGDPFRREAAVMVAIGWGVVACLPYRTERYLIFLLPLAALLVVRLLRRDASGAPRRYRGIWLALAVATTVPVAGFHYLRKFPDRSDLLAAARDYGVICGSDRSVVPVVNRGLEMGINVPFFSLFYGDVRRPVFVYEGWTQSALVRIDQRKPGERFLGLSPQAGAGPFRWTRVISRHGDWVVWEDQP